MDHLWTGIDATTWKCQRCGASIQSEYVPEERPGNPWVWVRVKELWWSSDVFVNCDAEIVARVQWE